MYTDMTKVEKCRLQNETDFVTISPIFNDFVTNTPILSVDFVISLPIFADFVTEWHTVFSSKAGQNGRKGALCDNLPTSL